ncbi:MAG: hypothetical protein P1V36_03015 [Planctomycetota bacterium]|nr:hypothetical protein [Planctomycetota bacterium]
MTAPVISAPGWSWWARLPLLGIAVVFGVGVFAGWIPLDGDETWWLAVFGVLGGGFGIPVTLMSWRRFEADARGLRVVRLGRQQLYRWSDIAAPTTRVLEPDAMHHRPQDHIGLATEPGLHVNTVRLGNGRVVCELSPAYTNRRAFLSAVREFRRTADEPGS